MESNFSILEPLDRGSTDSLSSSNSNLDTRNEIFVIYIHLTYSDVWIFYFARFCFERLRKARNQRDLMLVSNRNRDSFAKDNNAIAHRSTGEGAKGHEGVNGTRVYVYVVCMCARARMCECGCVCAWLCVGVCMRACGCVSSERKQVFINIKSIRSVYVL